MSTARRTFRASACLAACLGLAALDVGSELRAAGCHDLDRPVFGLSTSHAPRFDPNTHLFVFETDAPASTEAEADEGRTPLLAPRPTCPGESPSHGSSPAPPAAAHEPRAAPVDTGRRLRMEPAVSPRPINARELPERPPRLSR